MQKIQKKILDGPTSGESSLFKIARSPASCATLSDEEEQSNEVDSRQ